MAVPFSNTKLRVPRGFQNALEGLAREVLRSQPQNVYQFAATYFDSLLKIRDEEGFDPVETGAGLEDRYYNNNAFKQNVGDVSDPQQQAAAVKIQSNFRGYEARKDTSTKDEYSSDQTSSKVEKSEEKQEEEEVDIDLGDPDVEAAAVKIQAGFKGMKARKEVQEKKDEKDKSGEEIERKEATPAEEARPAEEEAKPAESENEEKEVVDIDLTDPDVAKAAVQIQAGFRGYKAREEVKQKKSPEEETGKANEEAEKEKTAGEVENKEEEEEIDIDLDDPNVEAAAVKIQAGFKGMKTRKEVKNKQETAKSEGGDEPAAAASETVATEAAEETAPAEKKSDESLYQDVDIDLNDPNVVDATIKIQAGFKGMKTRKDMREKYDTEKSEENEETAAEEEKTEENAEEKVEEKEENKSTTEEIDINLADPEVEKAAIKIQAGYKGFKTRKEGKQTGVNEETTTAEGQEVKESEGQEVKESEGQEEEGAAVASKDDQEGEEVKESVGQEPKEDKEIGQEAAEVQGEGGQEGSDVKVQDTENDSAVVEESAKQEENEDADDKDKQIQPAQ